MRCAVFAVNFCCCFLVHVQVAALAPDVLVGDNQYFCDYCRGKSDADRRMRLRSLPPYLCLALQRFTYDQQVGTRATYTCCCCCCCWGAAICWLNSSA
jgi:ubiquitin C-terminal hydrolase